MGVLREEGDSLKSESGIVTLEVTVGGWLRWIIWCVSG
jgi:hypothetical protein